jgi:hypothetical protein
VQLEEDVEKMWEDVEKVGNYLKEYLAKPEHYE